MNPGTPVSEIMTTKLTVVNEHTSIAEIAIIFDNNKFHHLPVVAEAGRLMGIISREDFLGAGLALAKNTSGKTLDEEKVRTLGSQRYYDSFSLVP